MYINNHRWVLAVTLDLHKIEETCPHIYVNLYIYIYIFKYIYIYIHIYKVICWLIIFSDQWWFRIEAWSWLFERNIVCPFGWCKRNMIFFQGVPCFTQDPKNAVQPPFCLILPLFRNDLMFLHKVHRLKLCMSIIYPCVYW